MPSPVVCPYCRGEFVRLDQHRKKCPVEPEIRARLIAFIAAISDGVYLPAAAIYAEKVNTSGADVPTVSALVRCYGSWSGTAEAFGMKLLGAVPAYDKECVWAALREWFDGAEPPYHYDDWDAWAEENGQPSARKITRNFGFPWSAIVTEMAYSTRYPIRDEEQEAAEYVGLGFRVARSYEAVYKRGGRMYTETRHVLR